MANKYTDAVYKCPLRATEKIVLWVLAEHADNETGVCWPGQSRIAHYAGMNYSTAQRALDKLVSRGLIKVTGQRPVRGSTALFTKEYTLDLSKIKSYLGEVEPDGDSSAPTGTGGSSAKARTGSGEPTGTGSSAPALTGSGKRTTVGGAPNELVLNSSLNSSGSTRQENRAAEQAKTDGSKTTPKATSAPLKDSVPETQPGPSRIPDPAVGSSASRSPVPSAPVPYQYRWPLPEMFDSCPHDYNGNRHDQCRWCGFPRPEEEETDDLDQEILSAINAADEKSHRKPPTRSVSRDQFKRMTGAVDVDRALRDKVNADVSRHVAASRRVED